MDPQQRVILEHGYKAFSSTGFDKAVLLGSNVGVFLGTGCVTPPTHLLAEMICIS